MSTKRCASKIINRNHAVAMLIGMSVIIFIAPSIAAAAPVYDPKPWLEDLEQTREALSTKYANLEWVVIEREIDLASLFAEAKAQLQSAASDSDARAAFDRLARRLGDGHVRFRWSMDQNPRTAPNADCAALGYDSRIRAGDAAALVPGYSPLTDAPAKEFPAGTMQVTGHTVGVIKIGIFTPRGMPELCAESLPALKLSSETLCGEACRDRIDTWVSDHIFTPIQYPYEEGVWGGPLIVLVNGGTGSAAEQFAAVLQDNHAAVVMGAPTVGAGCGHTNGGTPTTLKNSGGILELPDCARLRADGSNEVMGIQPDVLVGLRTTDGPHRQGIRVLKKLPEAVARAIKTGTESVRHP
jgi:Peptidase family S41